MSVKPFDPQFMKIGVLTAALQELTPREKRDPDPDRAIEEWVAFARELGADNIQLSAGAPSHRIRHSGRSHARSGRQHARPARAFQQRARQARAGASRRIQDRALGPRLLRQHAARRSGDRKKKHDFMLRVFDAAALLGVDAVCGFVGRNQKLEHGSEPRSISKRVSSRC